MAELEPSFALLETSGSRPTILGVTVYGCDILVTCVGVVSVFDTGSQRITRNYPLTEPRRFSCSATGVTDSSKDSPFVSTFLAVVDDAELWKWSREASALSDGVEKTLLWTPHIRRDGKPSLTALGDGGVAIKDSAGRIRKLWGREAMEFEVSSRAVASDFYGKKMAVVSRDDDADPSRLTCRIFHFESGKSAIFRLSAPQSFDSPLSRVFMREESVCVFGADGRLIEFLLPVADDSAPHAPNVFPAANDVQIPAGLHLLHVDSARDVAFALQPAANCLVVVGLKFGTILASREFVGDAGDGISCDLGTSFLLVVDGRKLLSFPYTVKEHASTLSFNFGKSSQRQHSTSAFWGKKRPSFFDDCVKALRSDPSAFDVAMLRNLNDVERSEMLRVVVDGFADVEGFCPPAVLQHLLSVAVVSDWTRLIEVLLERRRWDDILLALEQEGAGAADLCRIWRGVMSVAGDDDQGLMKRILEKIVSYAMSQDDLTKSLKTLSKDEVGVLLRQLLQMLNAFDSSRFAPGVYDKILSWASSVVDAHFVRLALEDDDQRLETLKDLAVVVADLEAYLEAAESLETFLKNTGEMEDVSVNSDEYFIQYMEF